MAWRRRSPASTPVMDPNRKRLRSPVYAPDELDMMATANARNPTNSTPIEVSSGSGEWLRIRLIPQTIARAATKAPIVV